MKKLTLLAFKYVPVIAAFIMCVHCLLLLLGMNFLAAPMLFSVSIVPAFIFILLSITLKYCKIHQQFVGYICAVSFCSFWKTHFGFGILLTPIRILVLLIGMYLFIKLYLHRDQFKICL